MPTVQQVASDAADWFETATKTDGETSYVRTKDGAPEWVRDLVFAAHGNGEYLPDDWRYQCISSAVAAIAEADDIEDMAHQFADEQVDVYTMQRFAWLASNLQRQLYVDEAAKEFGPADDISQAIGLGQYAEASEVFASVLASLEEIAETLNDAEAEDEIPA